MKKFSLFIFVLFTLSSCTFDYLDSIKPFGSDGISVSVDSVVVTADYYTTIYCSSNVELKDLDAGVIIYYAGYTDTTFNVDYGNQYLSTTKGGKQFTVTIEDDILNKNSYYGMKAFVVEDKKYIKYSYFNDFTYTPTTTAYSPASNYVYKPSCSVEINNLTIGGYDYDTDYYDASIDISGNVYRIYIDDEIITLTFSENSPEGVYNVATAISTYPKNVEVEISNYYTYSSLNLSSSYAGKVYVETINGELSISFCDVNTKDYYYSTRSLMGNARFNQ